VLTHHFNWKRLSMAAVLAHAPDGSEAKVMFSARLGTYNDTSLITFICQLRRQLNGDKIALIWDGLPTHHQHDLLYRSSWQRWTSKLCDGQSWDHWFYSKYREGAREVWYNRERNFRLMRKLQ